VILGSNTYDEELIAHDLWLLMLSHVFDSMGQIQSVDVQPSMLHAGQMTWHTSIALPENSVLFVAGFDPSDEAVTFIGNAIDATDVK